MKRLCKLLFVIYYFLPATKTFAQLTYINLDVQYDSAWTFKNLQLIPVKFKDTGAKKKDLPGTISLQEALQTGKISIKEMVSSAGPDISVLMIKNHSKKNILVHSGEMVAGGKQDRMIATTSIIPPGEGENYITVFCIEKGRWTEKVRPFNYAGEAGIALRKQMDLTQKQNEIWKEIDQQFHKENMQADTWPYLNLYKKSQRSDTAYLNYFKAKMKQSDSSFAGFIAISGNHIINCELFGTPEYCLLSYEGLINSYIQELATKNDPPTLTTEKIKSFADKFLMNETVQKNYLNTHGRIYRYGDKIIHLTAYD